MTSNILTLLGKCTLFLNSEGSENRGMPVGFLLESSTSDQLRLDSAKTRLISAFLGHFLTQKPLDRHHEVCLDGKDDLLEELKGGKRFYGGKSTTRVAC